MMKIKMRVFCWLLSLFCAIRTEGFAVRSPAMPLIIQLGASVTLPCSVDTPLPLRELKVQWMREDSESLVHLFQEGESRPESQSPAYSGRADFFSEEISKGNFSLLLRNVTTEDKGLYKCVVHTVHKSNETKVKIDIERLVVTGADLPIFAYAGEDVILNCSVDTHVPLKELQVEWMKTNGEILVLLFSKGENRPESQHERFRGRAEFFSEEVPKGNFSLKLRDVKTEDKGEFVCIVHTDRESANAPAWIRGLGFSSLHVWVLVLTIAAAAFAVLSCIPAVWCFNKADESNRALLLYCLQVSVPCILISIAFAIWGKIESSFVEANVCSTINLMRILVIFKVAPHMKLLPASSWRRTRRTFKRGSAPLNRPLPADTGENAGSVGLPSASASGSASTSHLAGGATDASGSSSNAAASGRPGIHYQRFTDLALPLVYIVVTAWINSVLLQNVLIYHAPSVGRKVASGVYFGFVLLCSLLAVYSSVLKAVPQILTQSFAVFLWLNIATCFEGAFLIVTHDAIFFSMGLVLGVVISCFGFLILSVCKTCLQRKKCGRLYWEVLLVLCLISEITVCFHYLDLLSEKDKDRPALMFLYAFLFILTAAAYFRRRRNLPAVPHILVYVFGSAVLSVINSVALATEVILKAEKGERTVDLRLIVFPLEFFFLAFWLVLQMCECYTTRTSRDGTSLSPPEQSTAHRQGTDDSPNDM